MEKLSAVQLLGQTLLQLTAAQGGLLARRHNRPEKKAAQTPQKTSSFFLLQLTAVQGDLLAHVVIALILRLTEPPEPLHVRLQGTTLILKHHKHMIPSIMMCYTKTLNQKLYKHIICYTKVKTRAPAGREGREVCWGGRSGAGLHSTVCAGKHIAAEPDGCALYH